MCVIVILEQCLPKTHEWLWAEVERLKPVLLSAHWFWAEKLREGSKLLVLSKPWAFISAQTFFILKYWHEEPSSAELSLLDFHLWRLKPTEMTQHSSGIQVSGKCKGITCLFYFSFSAEPQEPNVTRRKIQMCVDSRDREIPSQSFGLVFPCIILLAELGWQQHRPGPGWKEALLEHLLKPSLRNLEN